MPGATKENNTLPDEGSLIVLPIGIRKDRVSGKTWVSSQRGRPWVSSADVVADYVRELVRSGDDVLQARDNMGNTPLHTAAANFNSGRS